MSPVDSDSLPFPSNEILLRAQSQWLFTPSELLRTPSILDGLSPAQEHSNRSKGVNFVTQVGILLKLPQLTLATASVYLHRFYVRHSMVDLPSRPGLHHYAIAATSLFLATKVEENCRKMKELVVACCRVAQKQPNLVVDEQNKEYWRWRDTILMNEDLLLEALCFDLQLEHPYRILFDILCYYNVQDNKRLRNAAWAFVNDSNLTTLCLLFPPKTIAAAAFYAAAKHTDVAFPDDEWGRPWWEQLGLDIVELKRACSVLAEAYEENPLPRQGEKGLYDKEEAGVDEDGAKTRLASPNGNTDVRSLVEERPATTSEGSEEGEV
jgi:protein BUR2